MKGGGGGLKNHGGASSLQNNQIYTCFLKWGQVLQVVVWAAAQVGDFMSMVIGSNCGRFKNKHLGLLLKKKSRSKKGKKV
jgi:hypothetical protein